MCVNLILLHLFAEGYGTIASCSLQFYAIPIQAHVYNNHKTLFACIHYNDKYGKVKYIYRMKQNKIKSILMCVVNGCI